MAFHLVGDLLAKGSSCCPAYLGKADPITQFSVVEPKPQSTTSNSRAQDLSFLIAARAWCICAAAVLNDIHHSACCEQIARRCAESIWHAIRFTHSSHLNAVRNPRADSREDQMHRADTPKRRAIHTEAGCPHREPHSLRAGRRWRASSPYHRRVSRSDAPCRLRSLYDVFRAGPGRHRPSSCRTYRDFAACLGRARCDNTGFRRLRMTVVSHAL